MIIVNRSGLISCWPCDIFTQTGPPLTDTSHPEWWRPFRLSEIPFVFPPLKKTLAAASAATLLYIYGQSSVHSLPFFFLKMTSLWFGSTETVAVVIPLVKWHHKSLMMLLHTDHTHAQMLSLMSNDVVFMCLASSSVTSTSYYYKYIHFVDSESMQSLFLSLYLHYGSVGAHLAAFLVQEGPSLRR